MSGRWFVLSAFTLPKSLTETTLRLDLRLVVQMVLGLVGVAGAHSIMFVAVGEFAPSFVVAACSFEPAGKAICVGSPYLWLDEHSALAGASLLLL